MRVATLGNIVAMSNETLQVPLTELLSAAWTHLLICNLHGDVDTRRLRNSARLMRFAALTTFYALR
jgi:hypothetical protein